MSPVSSGDISWAWITIQQPSVSVSWSKLLWNIMHPFTQHASSFPSALLNSSSGCRKQILHSCFIRMIISLVPGWQPPEGTAELRRVLLAAGSTHDGERSHPMWVVWGCPLRMVPKSVYFLGLSLFILRPISGAFSPQKARTPRSMEGGAFFSSLVTLPVEGPQSWLRHASGSVGNPECWSCGPSGKYPAAPTNSFSRSLSWAIWRGTIESS